jgi:hypothetical protein
VHFLGFEWGRTLFEGRSVFEAVGFAAIGLQACVSYFAKEEGIPGVPSASKR